MERRCSGCHKIKKIHHTYKGAGDLLELFFCTDCFWKVFVPWWHKKIGRKK